MRAKLLSTAAMAVMLSFSTVGVAQDQTQQQQSQTQELEQHLQQAETALQQNDVETAQQALEQADQAVAQTLQQAQGRQKQQFEQMQVAVQDAQEALRQHDEDAARQALAQVRRSMQTPSEGSQPVQSDTATVDASTPSSGQSGQTVSEQQAETEIGAQGQDIVDANNVIGMTAQTPDGGNLGEVGDLVLNEQGAIEAAIIEVGGFLGIGGKEVAVDWDKVEVSPAGNQVVVNMTREELEAAPEYEGADQLRQQEQNGTGQ